jgi:leucyl aminopeptidase
MREAFRDTEPAAVPLTLVEPGGADASADGDGRRRAWLSANAFSGKEGQVLAVPSPEGAIAEILVGVARLDDIYALAALPGSLPPGDYRIGNALDAEAATRLALGWGLGAYRFSRYRAPSGSVAGPAANLVWPEAADRPRVLRELAAIALVRDLVNTPANAMGPAALAEAARAVAEAHGAACRVVVGDALIEAGYPTLHAVGRAAAEPARLVELLWGDAGHPLVTLVGKGITFDSGGLDIKSASNMLLMKKDMGGAAHALALGQIVMDAGLPVRLRVLLAVAENAVGPDANRPGDVIRTRSGLTVEIGDTDAEGRLVLADALADASEQEPALILDFATLTGAARVALGPELPALFATDDIADPILAAARATDDPLWRLPLWRPYRKQLDSKVADLINVAPNSFAGAIHAALFLDAFVRPGLAWAHLDLYAWNATERPGRPVGGEAFALRALFRMLTERFA